MAAGSFVQTDFSGGEWSRNAQGATSDPRYKTALARCLNSFPADEKCWVRRPGSRFAATTRKGRAAKLITYDFSEVAPYNMEFTDGHLRMLSGAELVKEAVANVVTISSALPAVLEVTSAQDWATDDEVEFSFNDAATAAALSYLAHRQFQIVKLTTTTFQLFDPVTGNPVNGTLIGWTGGLSLSVARVVDYATPYTDDKWSTVRSVQTDDFALILQNSVTPYVLSVTEQPTEDAPAQFTFNAANIKDGPYLDPVVGSTITPDGTIGLVNFSLGFTAYESTRAYAIGDYVTNASVGYRSLTDANLGNTPASSPTHWEVVSPGDAIGPNGFTANDIGRLIRVFSNGTRWTWGKIVSLSNTGLIDPNLTGAVHIGDWGTASVLNIAFDNEVIQATGTCITSTHGSGLATVTRYIGQNFSGATPQAITSAILYPSSNLGFANKQTCTGRVKLYAKATAPASTYDGTLLGTSDDFTVAGQGGNPVTVTSSDVTTTWNYVWLVLELDVGNDNGQMHMAEAQFFTSGGVPGAGVRVQILGPALASTATIATWRLGVYSASTGYPTCGCYHEGRLFLSGVIPNRWDASKSNDPLNFEPTSDAGVVADNNAVTYVFNSSDINTIFWLEPDQQGIVCGTQKGEWLIQASAANNPLTPTSAQAHRVTKLGCANIEPVRTGLTTVFVQRFRRQLYEYLADAYSGKFFGASLSKRAKHLTKSGIAELAYQQELTPILWSRMDDGSLKGATYRRTSMFSSQEPELLGWHRHELGSGRVVESICVGPSVDGTVDTLSMVTNDPETNIRHIEIMTNLLDEDAEITEAWFLDNAVVPSSGTIVEVAGVRHVRFSGLWHLNQKSVAVWAGGVDCGDYTVANGVVDVPLTHALFTEALLYELTTNDEDYGDLAVSIDAGAYTIPCVIGFTYTSDGQLLRPSDTEDSKWGNTGARNGPAFGKTRRIQEFAALLQNTQGIYFGTKFEKLRPANFKTPGNVAYTRRELFSDIYGGITDDGYTTEAQLCWRITRPYPASVLSLGGYLETQDK